MLVFIEFLHRQRLVDNTSHANRRVVHIDTDFLTQQLPTHVPHNRILIHRHARILGVEHQRVANGLHIRAESPDVAIAMNFSIDRVGVHVKRVDTNGVTMHVERVGLREVFHDRPVRGEARPRLFIIEQILAIQLVLVLLVDEDDIAEALALARRVVIEEAVAGDGLLLVDHR